MPGTDKPSLLGAIAMIVLGLLILIPSGLCTGLGLIAGLMAAIRSPNVLFNLPILLIGAPFVVGGGTLVWNGIRRIQARNAQCNQADPF